ncbi:MAG: GMC family oxidoreductase [Alphaproteobacteria bacterium]|nr:GMC family oxidoreductase [Alphaproteobacteria bacterium]
MSGTITIGVDLTSDQSLDCDVCIVGSGAGGSVLAAGLAQAGLDVVVLEAGPYLTRRDFTLHEEQAYPDLYQDRMGRATSDLAISILQGRSVGGSTTVNWTTCFRTPQRILDHWGEHHGIALSADELAPHFEAVEQRLSIHPWPEALANENNRKLLVGARALGWEAAPLRRNVKGCANSGYCGLGCPVNGKQAMHITYLPDAIVAGARLFADVQVDRLEVQAGRVAVVHARVLDRFSGRATERTLTLRPKVTVLSGGAVNNPALLLRSGLDGGGRVGRRTFLHPVVGIGGRYEQPVNPFYGAPQSIGSHQFIDRGPDKVGFFFESAPMQPTLMSTTSAIFGALHDELMGQLPHIGVMISLHVDGLLPGDEGGTVSLRSDGRIAIDYPITPPLIEAMKESHKTLAQLTFAAGAVEVFSLHTDPLRMTTQDELSRLDDAAYGGHEHAIFSAHQMGGCSMGGDPATSVVDLEHRFRGVDGLFVVDGSVLPTALGVNPSETIYGLSRRATAFVQAAV